MSEDRLPKEAFSEQAWRHASPDAQKPMRLMAAQGMVPVPPAQQLLLLHQLTLASEAEIRDSAVISLMEMPVEILAGALRECEWGAVLETLVRFREEPEVLEAVLLHPRVEDETLIRLARNGDADVADLIAGNEVRMLEEPAILENLYLNENARMSTVNRAIELARRQKLQVKGIPALRLLIEGGEEDEAIDVEQEEVDDEMFSAHLQDSMREEMEDNARDASEPVEEEEKEDKRGRGNRQAEIDRMSLSEKVRLATLGSQTDRDFLIRSPNRLVHMAAVQSPKVQYKDIYAWSGNKSLPEGVIGYIANHREYKKNYQVQYQLVNNPKLPLQIGVRLINFLHAKDLATLMKNRNISPQLRRSAKSLSEQREKRKR